MQWRGSFVPTEKPMACAMGAEEGQKWPPMRRLHPNSTAGAPNGPSRTSLQVVVRYMGMADFARIRGAAELNGLAGFHSRSSSRYMRLALPGCSSAALSKCFQGVASKVWMAAPISVPLSTAFFMCVRSVCR